MPDRTYRYRVEIDTAQIAGEAARLKAIFQNELRQVQIVPGGGANNAAVRAAIQQQVQEVRTANVQMQQAARTTAVQQQQLARQSTAIVVSQAQQQTAAVKAQLAQQTAAQRAALQQQAQAARQAAAAQRMASGGGIGGAVAGGIGRYAIGALAPIAAGLGAQAIIQQAVEADAAAAAMRRTSVAALHLAGTQEKLTLLLRTYEQAAGGAVTKAEAMVKVTQLQAIGFADNAEELRRFTVAARGASLATGHDIEYITSQLQLAIANQSTLRLDQLGLGVSEVKARIESLTNSMPGLSEEMRYQEAVLGLLTEKFGGIAESGEGAATGMELLRTALADLKLEGQSFIAEFLDPWARGMAISLGGGTRSDIQADLRRMAGGGTPWAGTAGRLDQLLSGLLAAQNAGRTVPSALLDQVTEAARTVAVRGVSNPAEQAALDTQLSQWENILNLINSGGIVLAQDMNDTAAAANTLTQALIQLAGQTYLVNLDAQGHIVGPLMGNSPPPLYGPFREGDPRSKQGWDVLGSDPFGLRGNWIPPENLTPEEKATWAAQRQGEIERERAEARKAADERAARAAEKSWKDAASATERAFRDAADELISSLRKVPGLLGTSSVTQEQLDLAKMGVPQNFADDYLRRVEDEVYNKKDYPDVSLSRLAQLGGIDQSLPPEAQVKIARSMWEDSSLFANPAALELINWGAVNDNLIRQERSKMGEQNILAHRGITPEGELTTGGVALLDDIRKGALEGLPAFAADFATQFDSALRAPVVTNQLMASGIAIGGPLGEGIISGVLGSTSGSALIDGIVAQVLADLNADAERP